MTLLYTALGVYDKTSNLENISWEKYVRWSGLTQLTELVSLDTMLNKRLVNPDYTNADDWNYIHTTARYMTGFFTSLGYVLKRSKLEEKFNLLALIFEPEVDCESLPLDDFDFLGYELLDQGFSISALTNCGGFEETFQPIDLNDKGLVRDFTRAYQIKKLLKENNPDEHHADTHVIAVWRHKTLGR